jgi:hypothetical protein
MFKYHLIGLAVVASVWLCMRYVELVLEVPETKLVEFDCIHVRADPRITPDSAKRYQNLVKYCPYDLLDEWAQLRYTPNSNGPQKKEIIALVLNRKYTGAETAKRNSDFHTCFSGEILMYEKSTNVPVLRRGINDRSFKDSWTAETILITTYPLSQFEQSYVDFRIEKLVTTPLQSIFDLQLSWSLLVHSVANGAEDSKASSIHLASASGSITLLLYCLWKRKLINSNIQPIMRPLLVPSLALSLAYVGLDTVWNKFHMPQKRINQINDLMFPLFKITLCMGLALLLHRHLIGVVNELFHKSLAKTRKRANLAVGAFSYFIPGLYFLITFLNNFERYHLPLISGMGLSRNKFFAKLGMLHRIAQAMFIAGFVVTSWLEGQRTVHKNTYRRSAVITFANLVLLMIGDYSEWNVGMMWSDRLIKQAVIAFNIVTCALRAIQPETTEKAGQTAVSKDDEETEGINT